MPQRSTSCRSVLSFEDVLASYADQAQRDHRAFVKAGVRVASRLSWRPKA
jgi:hypothetical protein